jgi:hypothetical protein
MTGKTEIDRIQKGHAACSFIESTISRGTLTHLKTKDRYVSAVKIGDPYVMFQYLCKEYINNPLQQHNRDTLLDGFTNVMTIKQLETERIDTYNARFKASYESYLLLRNHRVKCHDCVVVEDCLYILCIDIET